MRPRLRRLFVLLMIAMPASAHADKFGGLVGIAPPPIKCGSPPCAFVAGTGAQQRVMPNSDKIEITIDPHVVRVGEELTVTMQSFGPNGAFCLGIIGFADLVRSSGQNSATATCVYKATGATNFQDPTLPGSPSGPGYIILDSFVQAFPDGDYYAILPADRFELAGSVRTEDGDAPAAPLTLTVAGGAPFTSRTVATNTAGDYSTLIPSGTYTVTPDAPGAVPVSRNIVISNHVRDADFTLAAHVVSVADVVVQEGDSGTVTAPFVVSVSAVSDDPIEVQVATVDGSAKAPDDYTAVATLVTIPAGQRSVSVPVAVKGDTEGEGDETFVLHLVGAVGAAVGDEFGTATIADDDVLLQAALVAVPAAVELKEPFQLQLTVHNGGGATLTSVTPPAAFTLEGDGDGLALVSGATPPSFAVLPAGQDAVFVYVFTGTTSGVVEFRGAVHATADGVPTTAIIHCGSPAADGCSVDGRGTLVRMGGLDVTWKMPGKPEQFVQAWPTADGVIPEEEVNPDHWLVQLILVDAGHALEKCPPDRRYQWTVQPRGRKLKQPIPVGGDCRETIQVDREGVYDVTVEELHAADGTPTGRRADARPVVVQDWLIVGMGDSNGSGQGTAVPGDPYEFPQCDRGRHSYQARAAAAIEDADDKTSVTFIHTACSGARSAHLTNKKYVGQEPNPTNPLPPQITQVANRLKHGKPKREVDAVILSIGVNDIQFRSIITTCLTFPTLAPCSEVQVVNAKDPFKDPILTPTLVDPKAKTLDAVVQGLLTKLPKVYKSVANGLKRLKVRPNRVIITAYPDPTTDAAGQICGPSAAAPLMDQLDWTWISVSGLTLRFQVQATSVLGWTPVTEIPDFFFGHGLCAGAASYFQNVPGSLLAQGNEFGTFHSLAPGHELMGATVTKRLCMQMYGDEACAGLPREPGTKDADPPAP